MHYLSWSIHYTVHIFFTVMISFTQFPIRILPLTFRRYVLLTVSTLLWFCCFLRSICDSNSENRSSCEERVGVHESIFHFNKSLKKYHEAVQNILRKKYSTFRFFFLAFFFHTLQMIQSKHILKVYGCHIYGFIFLIETEPKILN